jgi:hypothetical protein
MNSLAVDQGTSSVARSHARQIFALGSVVLVGCVLFVISRKLVWGREESVTRWLVWTLALLPYFVYFVAREFSSWFQRLVGIVKRTDFLPIWTISLLSFVVMRGSTLASWYENPIYDATSADLTRYAAISAIYVGFAFATVTLWRLTRPNRFVTAANVLGLHATSTLVAWILFCVLIFLIAL